MKHLWDDIATDTLILASFVLVIIILHVILPEDAILARLTGEGFAALLAFLTRGAIARKTGGNNDRDDR